VLIDKQVLFKVEVGEGNVVKKYRNYAVKKASDDVGVIEQFMSKYNLEVVHIRYYNLVYMQRLWITHVVGREESQGL